MRTSFCHWRESTRDKTAITKKVLIASELEFLLSLTLIVAASSQSLSLGSCSLCLFIIFVADVAALRLSLIWEDPRGGLT